MNFLPPFSLPLLTSGLHAWLGGSGGKETFLAKKEKKRADFLLSIAGTEGGKKKQEVINAAWQGLLSSLPLYAATRPKSLYPIDKARVGERNRPRGLIQMTRLFAPVFCPHGQKRETW